MTSSSPRHQTTDHSVAGIVPKQSYRGSANSGSSGGSGDLQPARRRGDLRDRDSAALPPAEVAEQVGEATKQLGEQLRDPGSAYTTEELERIIGGLAKTVTATAVGLDAITEWLRATGQTGALSGQVGAVAERLGYAGDEIALLIGVLHQAQRRVG